MFGAAVQMTSAAGDCQGQVLNEIVDDVVIFATAELRDGAGGILAAAGPCFVRDPGALPIVGVMIFDSADLAALTTDGTLLDVITHEMLRAGFSEEEIRRVMGENVRRFLTEHLP